MSSIRCSGEAPPFTKWADISPPKKNGLLIGSVLAPCNGDAELEDGCHGGGSFVAGK